jgi:hypothetical protein
MPQYRAHIFDSDGKFQSSVPLECPDDDIALKQAKRMVDGYHVELWQHIRKIATFDHKPQRIVQA